MKTYIVKNYTNCDFCINEMASKFNMSSSNISQYFKEHSNQTIFDFVTELRMNSAKQLLTLNNLPLKAIAKDIGYYNSSSFIRRFKQINGVTPGEYRKLCIDNNMSK